MVMARKQTLVQLNDLLITVLDQRAAREGKSRSAVIREAVESYLRTDLDDEVGREIAEGYRRVPETDEELRAAERQGREMIREEPW
jgi:metal-responsive CopG/Arc/MetJ family transcriptional regulator